jgi:EmrB/QacA subfamily drug resistance transporter
MATLAQKQQITSDNYKWYVLAVVSVGTAMSALDGGIVNVAYPSLTRYFNVPITTISWVTLLYLVTSTAALTTFGRVADIFGRKWIYLGGLVVFMLGSAICGFSTTIWQLFAGRAIEGVGVAMALSNSIALLSEVFPAEKRGMAIGVLETAVAVALTVGPTIGGFLVSAFGWQFIFFVNLPLGVLNVIAGVWILRSERVARPATNLDLPGTLSFGFGVAFLLVALTQGPEQGWLSLVTLGGLAASFVTFVFFVVRERRIANPAVDLNLFLNNRAFSAGNLVKILAYSAFIGVNFVTPFYLDRQFGLQAWTIGLAMIPFTAAMTVGSFSSSLFADRFPARQMARLGLLIMAVGTAILGFSQPAWSYYALVPGLLLSGVGMGLFITPNDKTIMNAAPRDRLGVAASTLAMTRSLGMISGVALTGTLYSLVAGARLGGANFNAEYSLQGFHLAYFSLTVLCGLGVVFMTLAVKKE